MTHLCPDRTELESFCSADLTANRASEIEAHLTQCESCAAVLEQLSREALCDVPFASLAPAPEAPPPAVPGYELTDRLGAGGMGEVWKARQTALGRIVAVKFLAAHAADGGELRDRFRAEAKAVARLDHPNIVKVHEFDVVANRPYFSMEFVDGQSLASQLEAGPWAPERTAALVECVARAVHHAHAQNVLHRDLKPANILLTRDGTPKVADFGLAKRLDADTDRTRTGQWLGTPAYMSPEQAAGTPVGVGTDVYGLGGVLYRSLVGRTPFVGQGHELLDQLFHRDPVPPRRLRPELSRDLETICLRCLEKDPRRRFASCLELAEELQRYRSGEPIHSRPVGRAEKAWRWCRRHPARAGLAVALAALVVASIGFGLYADREAGKRQAAQHTHNTNTRNAAKESLGQAEHSLQNDSPAEAAIALTEANRRLSDDPEADPDGVLSARRTELENQLRLLQALERIRDRQWTSLGGAFDVESARAEYPRAFEAGGLRVTDSGAAERVQGWAIREQAHAALEMWLFVEPKRPGLLELLNVLDPDADRAAWRAAVAAGAKERQRQVAVNLVRSEQSPRFLAAYGELFPRDAAAKLLRAGWERNPKSFPLTFVLARHLSRGKPAETDEAIGYYHACLSLRPDHAPTLINLAVQQYARGNHEEALRKARAATALVPPRPEAFFNLGFILHQQGQLAESIEAYTAALAIEPRFAPAQSNLGMVHLADDNPVEAETAFRAALRINTHDPAALFNLGLVLKDRKRPESLAEAVRCFQSLTEKAPMDAPAWCQLGLCLRSQANFDEALKGFELGQSLKHPGASGLVQETREMQRKYALLPAVLKGEHVPKSATEFMTFALLCKDLGRYRDVFQLFDAHPRYPNPPFAAGVAVRLANGEGADPLPAEQRRERRQAALLDLRRMLTVWKGHLGAPDSKFRSVALTALKGWLTSDDFVTVRHPRALKAMFPEDRKGWEDFWTDVRQTLKQAEPDR